MASPARHRRLTRHIRVISQKPRPDRVTVHDRTALTQNLVKQHRLTLAYLIKQDDVNVPSKSTRETHSEPRATARLPARERDKKVNIGVFASIAPRVGAEQDRQADVTLHPQRLAHSRDQPPVLTQVYPLTGIKLDLPRTRTMSTHRPTLHRPTQAALRNTNGTCKIWKVRPHTRSIRAVWPLAETLLGRSTPQAP